MSLDDSNIDVKIGIFAGSNLPMFLNVTHGTAANRVNRKGCVAAGCATPVNCPAVLRVKADDHAISTFVCKGPV